jgi:SAM-dependent methyltransferase
MGGATKAKDFWDREVVEATHITWMANASIREYVNSQISGLPDAWPMDWFAHWLGGRRFRRALSVGCGAGAMERDLIRRDICDTVDAFDASSVSIGVARQLAKDAHVEQRIHYYEADFNSPTLPSNRYDLVVFHQSAHHVAKLEKLYAALLGTMTDDGLLYMDEYVGPSRFDWSDDLLSRQRALYDEVPSHARRLSELPLPIHGTDPSEAIRSSEILPQLAHGFELIERRDYGGVILSILYPVIDWSAAPPGLIDRLIDADRVRLTNHEQSYYSIVIARPKRGIAKARARTQYFLAPKVRRIRWEVRKILTGDDTIPF